MIDLSNVEFRTVSLTARELSLVRMTALKLHAHYVTTHGGDSTPYDLQVIELDLVSEAEQDQIGDVIEDVVTC